MQMNVAGEARRPLLTIAIPTFNRSGVLRQLLVSLSAQIPDDGSVEVLISDNASPDETSGVVDGARKECAHIGYIRNPENIGPDANFLQCYERAAGKYVWIFSDDDLFRPGALKEILNFLSREEYDLIYVSSAGFVENSLKMGPITSPPRTSTFIDAAQFVRRVHVFTTMISGNIINKDRVEATAHEPFSNLIGSSLIQLGWTFTALRGHRKSLFIEDDLIYYRLGNTGGYGVCQVFGPTLSQIADQWLQIPRLNRLILNASLQRLLPPCLLSGNRNAQSKYLNEDPHAVLSGVFAGNLRYWLFDYPLVVLPSGLAWTWFQFLRIFNRIDRACGYPSLGW
jgi:abequosyltransferase